MVAIIMKMAVYTAMKAPAKRRSDSPCVGDMNGLLGAFASFSITKLGKLEAPQFGSPLLTSK